MDYFKQVANIAKSTKENTKERFEKIMDLIDEVDANVKNEMLKYNIYNSIQFYLGNIHTFVDQGETVRYQLFA